MFFDVPAGWTRALDLYCERTSPDFFAEPLNAFSNIGFLVAAWLCGKRMQRTLHQYSASDQWALRLLVGLIAAIGAGSFVFHTVATVWSAWLDIVPIQIFILAYVMCFVRFIAGASWRWAWLGIPAFIALAWVATPLARSAVPANSAAYVPALVGLAMFALWAIARGHGGARLLSLATLVFGLSLTLRTVDEPWCGAIASGTHFLWHLLNAVTLALAFTALGRSRDSPTLRVSSPRSND